MKNLVVYYSWKGNTEVAVKELSELIGGDLKRIEETKPRKSFGMAACSAVFGLKSKIGPMDFSLNGYDSVFLGGPVWAGRSTPAVNAFLERADFSGKKVYLFITQADEHEPQSVFQSLTQRVKLRGGEVSGCFFLQTVMKSPLSPDKARKSFADWVKNLTLDKVN
ncbi:flavodoxin family protein [Caproiciproducens sp. CPB-2]|uniref:flavodoxin family protein n=1 Tax=Caproiciproducens sp. CPB-2 TaxID=3030017 RepID=UPI0023DB3AF9|nr:flavodoxin [Caproiciproducens sp. CPB-2]MDF1495409.1 flavodoxin [Caproiciproducens sp. CPB-2]